LMGGVPRNFKTINASLFSCQALRSASRSASRFMAPAPSTTAMAPSSGAANARPVPARGASRPAVCRSAILRE